MTAIMNPDVDERIKPLVLALNRLPGVHTLGSCGGHVDPTPFQRPAHEWYVTCQIEDAQSLEIIAGLPSFCLGVSLLVFADNPGFLTGSLTYELNGSAITASKYRPAVECPEPNDVMTWLEVVPN